MLHRDKTVMSSGPHDAADPEKLQYHLKLKAAGGELCLGALGSGRSYVGAFGSVAVSGARSGCGVPRL
jgi:hypothetical protein